MNDNKTEEVRSTVNKESWISRYSIFVGRINAVPIYINFSFAFVFILITWTLSSTILPTIYPGLVQSTYIIMGIVCAFISLFSILLHEVGHSIIANNYGINNIFVPMLIIFMILIIPVSFYRKKFLV